MKLLEKEFTQTLSSENVIMVINTKCWECAVQTGNHFLFNNYNHLQRGTGGVQDPSNQEKYMYVPSMLFWLTQWEISRIPDLFELKSQIMKAL